MDVVLFPAHAGVILQPLCSSVSFVTFPRTRGGDPTRVEQVTNISLFSPHTRG